MKIRKNWLVLLFIFMVSLNLQAKTLLDSFETTIENGIKKVGDYISGEKKYSISDSMEELHSLVIAATDRANLFIEWDVDKIRNNAEELFDETISALEDYILLVETDGLVNQAVNRIKATALSEASANREKANRYKNLNRTKYQKKYLDLAKQNRDQAVRVDDNWQLIVTQRERAKEALEELKFGRALYVDISVTEGIEAALGEMEMIAQDLRQLSSEMNAMKDKILNTETTNLENNI